MVNLYSIQRFSRLFPSSLYSTSNLKARCFSDQHLAVSDEPIVSIYDKFELGRSSAIKQIRCAKENPAEHTLNDKHLFYKLSNESCKRMISSGSNNKAFTRKYLQLSHAFNETSMMIRDPGLELVNYLRNTTKDGAVNRYLLYGKDDSGKSMTLQYAVDYGISQGWLIVPNYHMWDWVAFIHKYKLHKRQELIVSQHNPDRVDQPELSARWLETFRWINQPLLDKIFTTKKYHWSKHESSEAGISFQTLVDYGISRPRNASDVIGCISREIRIQDHTTMPTTLVAVDCANAMFGPTRLHLLFGPKLKTDQLSVLYNLKKLLSNKWKNGAVVAALDSRNAVRQKKVRIDVDHPYDLLGREGFDALDPHVPIHVPRLSKEEVIHFLAYFKERKWLVGRSLTKLGEDEILQLTRSPRELLQMCGFLY